MRFSLTRKVAERFLTQIVRQQTATATAAELAQSNIRSSAADSDAKTKQYMLLHEQAAAVALFERLRARQLALHAACGAADPATLLGYPYTTPGFNPVAMAASGYPYAPALDFSLRSIHQPTLGAGGGFELTNESGDLTRSVLKTPQKVGDHAAPNGASLFTSPLRTHNTAPKHSQAAKSTSNYSAQRYDKPDSLQARHLADEAINYSVQGENQKKIGSDVRARSADCTPPPPPPPSPRRMASKPPLPPASYSRQGSAGPGFSSAATASRRQAQPTPGYGGTLISPTGKRRVLCTACQKTFCDKGRSFCGLAYLRATCAANRYCL